MYNDTPFFIFMAFVFLLFGTMIYFAVVEGQENSLCEVACIEANHDYGLEKGGSCQCKDYTVIPYPGEKD